MIPIDLFLHRRLRSGDALLAAAITAAAFSGPAAAAPRPASLEIAPCTLPDIKGAVRCGVLTVPENYARPQGRKLRLKVVVVPAQSPTPREPIYLLSGGPGQAATNLAADFANTFRRREHDIVMIDQRGTAGDHKLQCDVGSGDNLQGYLEPLFSEEAVFRACRDRLASRADLAQYTTPIAMRDLDELRAALGHRKIVLEGGSYGSRAAIAYAHAYEDRLAGLMLTSLAPMSNRMPLYHAAAAQRAFDLVAAQCAEDRDCHAAFPDVAADLHAVMAILARTPAPMTVVHPATGAKAEILMSDRVFADGVRTLLYSVESGRTLPLLLSKARKGDYSAFAQAAVNSGYGVRMSLALGETLAVSCPEDVVRIDPAEIKEATGGSFVGEYRVRGQMTACKLWPPAPMPAGYYAPFKVQAPALLLSGQLDPVTPPSWGEEALKTFPHGVHLVLAGAHSAETPCIEAIKQQFLTLGGQGLELGCLSSQTYPPFALR